MERYFSSRYVALRRRLLELFIHNGQVAEEVFSPIGQPVSIESMTGIRFGDQTVYLGFALSVFAMENAILVRDGAHESLVQESHRVVRLLLDGFDACEKADQVFYGASINGFFLRDAIDLRNLPPSLQKPGLDVKSDFSEQKYQNGPHHLAAMSIDQVVHIFLGLWTVAKYCSDPEIQTRARSMMKNVMDYLGEVGFIIGLPDGRQIPADRGREARGAAGFLCRMLNDTCHQDALSEYSIDTTMSGDEVSIPLPGGNDLVIIPDWKIPASVKTKISHAVLLKMEGLAEVLLTGNADIELKFSLDDLFPGRGDIVVPCIHMTSEHANDKIVLPCVHMVQEHPGGHKYSRPCEHMTTAHEYDSQWLPCLHVAPIHDSHRTPLGRVRCWHLGVAHPGGHENRLPCVHPAPLHPNGHEECIPCVHMVRAHPEGHSNDVPCVHLVRKHPEGHPVRLSVVLIPIRFHSFGSDYARNLAMLCFAFEPNINTDRFRNMALSSNHPFSVLLRAMVKDDVSIAEEVVPSCLREVEGLGDEDPSDRHPTWFTRNRWVHCSKLEKKPDDQHLTSFNGLDYLLLEGALRILKKL